jgi:hypothetical protein
MLLASVVTLASCGGGDETDAKGGARPTTTARLRIVQPTANQVTGPSVQLKLELTGGKVVSRTSGALTGTEGHIHVTLDGKLVSMAYGTEQDLTDLTPGTHSVQAEFVALDHAPFENRVIAAVLFTVR